MAQLSEPRDYALYWFRQERSPEVARKAAELTQEDKFDAHAGNSETSTMLATKPEVVHKERSNQQSGVDQERMKNLEHIYTGIWWYASFPNHYGGDGSKANAEAGELLINETVDQLGEMISKSLISGSREPGAGVSNSGNHGLRKVHVPVFISDKNIFSLHSQK